MSREITPDELIVIQNVARRLSSRFRFGYHEADDIYNEAVLMGINGLEKYDGKRPLENFLYIHVKNRLMNFKRDKFERLDKPCSKCPLKAYIKKGDICTAFDVKKDCPHYSDWLIRNQAKKSLMSSTDINDQHLFSPSSSPTEELVEEAELLAIIDKFLPLELRTNYLKMRAGHKLSKKHSTEIRAAVLEIMRENGYV